jgi:hypothetical protein
MSTPRRLAKYLPALALVALAIPTSAFGQATRTWVSGTGDDANPCSRTAPCKTFAGAYSKTAAGGEINCIDAGGFGAVTIGKSLAIKCANTEAGVLVSNTNAIVINAATTDKVTLKGLDINGLLTGGAPASIVGVKVLQAKSVHLIDDEIYGFQAGVATVPTGASTRVLISGSHIHANGVGVFDGPGNAGGTSPITTIRNSIVADNTCGAAVSSFGSNNGGGAPLAGTDCGAAGSGSGLNTSAQILAFHTGFHDNDTGVYSRGAAATFEIAFDEITSNNVFGVHRVDSGNVKTFTPATNVIDDNGASDAPNQTGALTKRAAKQIRG